MPSIHKHITLLLLAMIFLSWLPQAYGETILLRNIYLANKGDQEKDSPVSILIKDKKLDIISKNTIPIDQVDRAYEGAGGIVLGNLEPGKLASFLVLAKNPKDDIEKLLDTKRYARFANYKGVLLKNYFIRITEESPEGIAAAKQGWLSYSTPPIAVPLNYLDSTRLNKLEGERGSTGC
jgi:hypothetical protein